MANLILGNSVVSDALEFYGDFTSNSVFTSEVNKLWRAKILLDRKLRPAKTGATDTISAQAKERKQNVNPVPTLRKYEHSTFKPVEQGSNVAQNERFKTTGAQYRHDEIVFSYNNAGDGTEPISNIDRFEAHRNAKPNTQIILYNFLVSPVQYIVLQTVPKDIEFHGESTWAVIRSIGRNTPMYHFTGAESVIQMNVSWYANDKSNPEEVVAKCRLLEAWTKANAYLSSPPVLKIQWGDSDLFKDQYFILTAATYRLSNWKASSKVRVPGTSNYEIPNGYADPKMYPSTATQELILRRVSADNLSYQDIIPQAWVDKTHGINSGKHNPNQLI